MKKLFSAFDFEEDFLTITRKSADVETRCFQANFGKTNFVVRDIYVSQLTCYDLQSFAAGARSVKCHLKRNSRVVDHVPYLKVNLNLPRHH